MNFKNIFKRNKAVEQRTFGAVGLTWDDLLNVRGADPLCLSAVFRSVEVISNSLAMLPIGIFKTDPTNGFKQLDVNNDCYYLLQKQVNNCMTRYTFIKMLVSSALLKGAGYAYIKRVNGHVDSLYYIPYEYVSTYLPDTYGGNVYYKVKGIPDTLGAEDLIVLLNVPDPTNMGLTGLSTLSYAATTIDIAKRSEAITQKYLSNGGGKTGIISSKTQRFNDKQAQEIKSAWNSTVNSASNQSSVIIVPAEIEYTPLNISQSDQQLLESRAWNVIDIARFFGVSPTKLFDFSKSSYSTLEQTELSFLTDTLQPWLEKIELELETKLFGSGNRGQIDVRFDLTQFLRADKTSQSNYVQKMFQCGGYSINEVRTIMDLPPLPDEIGNKVFVASNLQTADRAVLNPIGNQTTTDQQAELQENNQEKQE